jgi:zinc/manganese transport system substrate-binding protein
MGARTDRRTRQVAAWLAVVVVCLLLTACSGATLFSADGASGAVTADGRILAVGAENEYADVITQIGGQYVAVTSILNNPNVDPHAFEASPSVAAAVAAARLVVQNGVGYDEFMNKIESATAGGQRKVITVQSLLGLPDSTPNPHLWYQPTTMPAVAKAIGEDLSALDPAHAAYFAANVARFDASLAPWYQAIAALKRAFPSAPVATTEPVADYLLTASGLDNLTPFTFQADVMNGVDPAPQDISLLNGLFNDHVVKAFVYNQQVTDSLTQSLLQLAHHNHIPVVGVYETMPTPGYHYQSWMLAEVDALTNALAHGTSAPQL